MNLNRTWVKQGRYDRLTVANDFIRIIAHRGRKFFYYQNRTSFFRERHGRLYFVDKYTLKEIYLHYRYWNRGFTEGGTLRSLVIRLKEYILYGKQFNLNVLGPWPEWTIGDLWGYGKDMERIRQAAIGLGIAKKHIQESNNGI